MADEGSRREELITGVLAGDLTPAEQAEFERAAAADPTMRTDLAELRELTDRLASSGVAWREEDVPALADPIASSPDPIAPTSTPLPPTSEPSDELANKRADRESRRATREPRRFRPWIAGVAAGSVLIGAVGAIGVQALTERPPTGPPGTLGAVETVSLSTRPATAAVTAELVAHTWGTETVLEIDGLAVGETYDVVLLDRSGRPVESGAFLGSRVTVTCRMNAALLRQDVTALQIKDDAGQVVAAGSVPVVN